MPDIVLPVPGQTAWALPLNDAINAINSAFEAQNSALPEQIQDTLASSLVAGSNVTIVYDDTAGTITISSTGGGGGGGVTLPIAQTDVTGLVAALNLKANTADLPTNLPSDHGVNASGQRVPVSSSTTAWLTGGLVVSQSATASSIAQRATGGRVTVGTPTADSDAATKLYVDGAVSAVAKPGNVFTIDYVSGAYPLRNTPYGILPANAVVIWRGPVAPTAGSGYALDTDQWSVVG